MLRINSAKDLNTRFFVVFMAQNDTPRRFRKRF